MHAVLGGGVSLFLRGEIAAWLVVAYLLESEERDVDVAVDAVATSEPVFKRLFAERFKAEPEAVPHRR